MGVVVRSAPMRALRLVALASLAACTPTAIGGTGIISADASAADVLATDVLATKDGGVLADVATVSDVTTASDIASTPDVPAAPDVAALPDIIEPVDVPSAPDVIEPIDVVTTPDVPSAPDVVTTADVPTASDAGGACRSDRDCSTRNQVCDLGRAVCVDCLRDLDCLAPNTFCLANRCAARVACTSSRMCPGQVCDTTRMLCVDCVGNNDCATGQTCAAGACVTSTTRCTPNAVECADATSLRRCSVDGMTSSVTECPPAPGAAGRCAAGVCSVTCLPGFADCDANPANGCEVSTRDSAMNCGACGNRCAPMGDAAVGACSAGRCALVCPAGRGDCDGNAANGCETDTTTSATNCGVCGVACGTGVSCSAGACAVMIRGLGGSTGFGPDVNCLAPNDDGSYTASVDGGAAQIAPVSLGNTFGAGVNYFGTTYAQFYVNNNGNISFRQALGSFTPAPFPTTTVPVIAPWWADVDTRGGGRPGRNNVCWYLESGRAIVTWDRVGYFSIHDDLQNSFQIVLRNRADVGVGEFDVEFRYERCAWTTGDASNGAGGLGGTPAQAGFDAGDMRRALTHPLSRTAAILNLCRTSNVGQTGVWRYTVRGGVVAPAM